MAKRTSLYSAATLGIALLLSGCQQQATTNESTGSAESKSTSASTQVENQEPKVDLALAAWPEVETAITAHKGKIVVLDIWSNYCPPCVKELPGLATLNRDHQADVACISFNCSYTGSGKPEDDHEQALKFLSKAGVVGQNFLSSQADQEVYQQLQITGVPVIRVYDRNGKLSKQFDNDSAEYGEHGFTYEQHVIPYVRSLIDKPE